MIYKESFNGNMGDEILRSISDKTFQTVLRAPRDWNAQEKYWRMLIINVYEPFCLAALHKALKLSRKHVMRKGNGKCACHIIYTLMLINILTLKLNVTRL